MYQISSQVFNDKPVYKHVQEERYLFCNNEGKWTVYSDVNDKWFKLRYPKPSHLPPTSSGWLDSTLSGIFEDISAKIHSIPGIRILVRTQGG